MYKRQLLRQAGHSGLPTILIGRALPEVGIDSISSNYQRGSEVLFDYLLELGHRRIAFLGADISEAEHIGRLRGYLSALRRARIKLRTAWVVGDGEHAVSYTHLDVYKRQVYIWPSDQSFAVVPAGWLFAFQ